MLGYENFEDYVGNGAYPGSIIGRTAGRIGNGIFSIDGIIYDLNKNNGKNSLHGRNKGLNTKIFNVRELGKWNRTFHIKALTWKKGIREMWILKYATS